MNTVNTFETEKPDNSFPYVLRVEPFGNHR